ncbi:MAG: hypothetical protein R3321_03225 [Nitrososphaeraceae archaeon]|nr:hypothetical protein [Nitrososphaeraceae archaeon]
MNEGIKINVNAKKILIFLILLVSLLIILSITGQVYRYNYNNGASRFLTAFFNVDVEYNLPTWVNTLYLLINSLLLFVITFLNRKAEKKHSSKWLILAFIFFILSTDEIIKLHENLNTPIIHYFKTSGYLHFAWIIPGTIFLLILAITYYKFLFYIPRRTMLLFITSGIIFVCGAIVTEALGGNYVDTHQYRDFTYVIFTTVEESLEMIGLSLFIYSLLDYINNEYKDIHLSFTLRK